MPAAFRASIQRKLTLTLPTTLLTRRTAAFALAIAVSAPAWAAAPLQKTQAPGFYRMMLGRFEITALSDGLIDMDVGKLLTNTTAEHVKRALDASFEAPVIAASVNAFLVNTGDKLVLIDAGTGPSGVFGPALGRLVQNLVASGYRPEQVDEVYITHLHPDHVGGLATPAGAAFPNAIIRMDRRESDYWLDARNEASEAADHRPFFAFAASAMKPYTTTGKLKPFDGDTVLLPGIRAIPESGHTRGHTVYRIESEGQRLLVWGDVVHVPSVQFRDPQVTIVFDSDSPSAAKARARVFADVASSRTLIAAAHLPFPGIGHLRRAGRGYDYVPLPFGDVK